MKEGKDLFHGKDMGDDGLPASIILRKVDISPKCGHVQHQLPYDRDTFAPVRQAFRISLRAFIKEASCDIQSVEAGFRTVPVKPDQYQLFCMVIKAEGAFFCQQTVNKRSKYTPESLFLTHGKAPLLW